MKFCAKCGKELNDEAEICIGCGCIVQDIRMQCKREKIKRKLDATYVAKITTIFNFIFTIAVALSIFFLFLSIYNSRISFSSYTYSTYFYFFVDYVMGIWAFIFALPAFALSITSLVLSVTKKFEQKELFSAISRVTIGFFLCIASLVYSF